MEKKIGKYQIVIVLNGRFDPENALTHMGSVMGVSFGNKEDAQEWVDLHNPVLRERNCMSTYNSDTHYEVVCGEEEFNPTVESDYDYDDDYDYDYDDDYDYEEELVYFGKKS